MDCIRCSEPNCYCTHEVNRHTNLPLGIPSSPLCKGLRMHIHELMRLSGKPKDELYKLVMQITGKDEDNAHMAKMGIQDCVKVIQEFNKLFV